MGNKDWMEELDFKRNMQISNAVTAERLKSELKAREADLEKVRTLD